MSYFGVQSALERLALLLRAELIPISLELRPNIAMHQLV